MSTGKRLVEIDVNPTNDPYVQRVKEICAELMDICEEYICTKGDEVLIDKIYDHTRGQIFNTRLCVEKLLTLPD